VLTRKYSMNKSGGEDVDEDLKKKRAKWLDEKLQEQGFPKYGRATQISQTLKAGMSPVQGWMRGSLPRDMELAYRFCKEYSIDFYEWVSLKPSVSQDSGENLEREKIVVDAVVKTKEFEQTLVSRDVPHPLNVVAFVKVFEIILESLRNPGSGQDKTLEFIHTFVTDADKPNKKNGGANGL